MQELSLVIVSIVLQLHVAFFLRWNLGDLRPKQHELDVYLT